LFADWPTLANTRHRFQEGFALLVTLSPININDVKREVASDKAMAPIERGGLAEKGRCRAADRHRDQGGRADAARQSQRDARGDGRGRPDGRALGAAVAALENPASLAYARPEGAKARSEVTIDEPISRRRRQAAR
jgi:hypothetical protein